MGACSSPPRSCAVSCRSMSCTPPPRRSPRHYRSRWPHSQCHAPPCPMCAPPAPRLDVLGCPALVKNGTRISADVTRHHQIHPICCQPSRITITIPSPLPSRPSCTSSTSCARPSRSTSYTTEKSSKTHTCTDRIGIPNSSASPLINRFRDRRHPLRSHHASCDSHTSCKPPSHVFFLLLTPPALNMLPEPSSASPHRLRGCRRRRSPVPCPLSTR
jgi:hypothetical protein